MKYDLQTTPPNFPSIMSNAPASTMEHQMRFTFRLPPQLMVDYAQMQARIKKREAVEWERFATAVADYYSEKTSGEEDSADQVEQQAEGVATEVVVETAAPTVVNTADMVCKMGTECKIAVSDPKVEVSSRKTTPVKIKTVEPPTDSQSQQETTVEQPTTTNADDNVSESGKRTVVRWTQDEDEYLRELMTRFDNDFAKVAKEMKTRNARQCKSRWELLNRPADESGKKKKGKKAAEEETETTD